MLYSPLHCMVPAALIEVSGAEIPIGATLLDQVVSGNEDSMTDDGGRPAAEAIALHRF